MAIHRRISTLEELLNLDLVTIPPSSREGEGGISTSDFVGAVTAAS